ncbi:barstar family protein [Nocardia sp. NPDC058705]|uniref:barstar family protein n=1 Tax=Nocardia sp. NPDC058705 TaxID=3346609 RepID=UPI0036AE367C
MEGCDSSARFSLYLDDLDTTVLQAEELLGFFDQDSVTGCVEFALQRATVVDIDAWRKVCRAKHGSPIGMAGVRFLDRDGLAIGTIDVFEFAVVEVDDSVAAMSGDRFDVRLTGIGSREWSSISAALWRERQVGGPTEMNTWVGLPRSGCREWLSVALAAGSRAQVDHQLTDRQAGVCYTLDAAHIDDEVSFFCALGEAINGPGGYFGAGLDGMADCLCGDFGATVPFSIRCDDWHGLVERLGKPFVDAVEEVFQHQGVKIVKELLSG